MRTKRFNVAAYGLPKIAHSIPNFIGKNFVVSNHALEQQKEDRYGSFTLPLNYIASAWDVFEVETVNGILTKVLARQRNPHKNGFDTVVCFAVDCVNDMKRATVKTNWLNRSNDNHKTLDLSAFDKP